jgi:hypothetical protein
VAPLTGHCKPRSRLFTGSSRARHSTTVSLLALPSKRGAREPNPVRKHSGRGSHEAVARAIQAEAQQGPEATATTMEIDRQCAEILKFIAEEL